MTEESLQQQLSTLLRIRWQAIAVLVGISLIAALVGRATWQGLWPPLILLAIVLAAGLVPQWGMRWWLPQHPQALRATHWLLMMLDLLVMAALCHFTGGIVSLYVHMPLLYIVMIAPLFGPQPAYAGAAWTSTLYGAMVLLETHGVMPQGRPLGPGRDFWIAAYEDPAMVTAFFLLASGLLFLGAYVGSTIAKRLARQREEITHLFQEAHREARKMHMVNELSRALSAILEWPTLLARVWTELQAVLTFDDACLYLYDEEAGQLRLVATRGLSDQEARTAEATAMERHPGWVLRNRRPLLVTDATQDPRVRHPNGQRSAALLMVPLLYQERCLGILGLGSKQTDRSCWKGWLALWPWPWTTPASTGRCARRWRNWARPRSNWSARGGWLRWENWPPAWLTN